MAHKLNKFVVSLGGKGGSVADIDPAYEIATFIWINIITDLFFPDEYDDVNRGGH